MGIVFIKSLIQLILNSQTIRGFKFVDSGSVPQPSFNKQQILEVQWKCNFNEIDETKKLNPWAEIISN